jgi:hypothetical protein
MTTSTSTPPATSILCCSGRHAWLHIEDRRRCCNGYVRILGLTRKELEDAGAEEIVQRQLWRGWVKTTSTEAEE